MRLSVLIQINLEYLHMDKKFNLLKYKPMTITPQESKPTIQRRETCFTLKVNFSLQIKTSNRALHLTVGSRSNQTISRTISLRIHFQIENPLCIKELMSQFHNSNAINSTTSLQEIQLDIISSRQSHRNKLGIIIKSQN